MKSVKFNPLTSLVMAAALAIGLAACGGGGTTAMPEPEPTPYEQAVAGIAEATTAPAAQAAYDAVKGDVTAAEGARLQAAVDARVETLAMMGRAAEQKMALMTAAGNIDTSDLSTQAAVDAAETAIAALEAALAAATDVSDADKAMYQGRVTAAETAVASAQSALDHDAQTMALSDAVTALRAIDLSDLSDQAKIDAANAAIAALRMALDAAVELSAAEKTAAMTELATASRTVMAAQGSFDTESQMMVLADAVAALEMVDLDNLMTQAQIDAANEAIIALDAALDAATHLTDAQKLDALTDVTLAKRKVTAAETVLAENVGSQRMALTEAGAGLAAIDLADLDTAEKIAAANEAVEALRMALANATHLSDAAKAMYQMQLDTATETVRVAQTGMDRDGRMMAQRTAIMDAVTMARTAVAMVDDDATDAQVTAADDAVAALKAAIDGAVDLSGDTDVAAAQGTLATLEGQLASAKTSRMAAMDEDRTKEAEMTAATAAKLYAGISVQMGDGDLTNLEAGDRDAGYDTAGTAIEVSIGGETAADAVITLSEDKDTMVTDNHGWEGKRYADPAGGDMVEAFVYSNVGEPTEGDMISTILTDGVVPTDTLTGDTGNVASPRFDHSAGTKEFELPDPNPTAEGTIVIPGSYSGVPGNYNCATTAGTACTVAVADEGFTLGGGTAGWTFTPTDEDTRLMSVPDNAYASYGWWLRKSADGSTYTASAFANERGGDTGSAPAAALDTLNGTATYMGGAAGKYALSSSTGGTNDAGHFTARAMLEANFTNNSTDTAITGTIDQFVGADGASRDWSVKLNGSQISDIGLIGDASPTPDDVTTTWTIDGTAAAAAGNWTGSLRENGDDDGVPAVATGTFYSEYGTVGRMVGAFGANKQ